MSEKRFVYGETDLFEWVEDNGEMISTKECVNKLNEQEATINQLKEENEQLQKEVKNRSAFIIDKGLGDTFVRWKNDRKSQIREV